MSTDRTASQPSQAAASATAAEAAVLVLDALRALLGEAHVLVPQGPDDAEFIRYQTDWRGRYKGHALAIVRPGNTDEVAAVVKLCARHAMSIVPQGGHTGLVGGGVPDASGRQIVLSLQRLRRVLAVDAANLSMTVEAGCLLAEVQAAADQAGLLFPLSLASEGSCTIGGNLATNAGGTQVLRYGTARELCLGLEAVSAQGEVWHGLKSLRKDNTGYDLRDLIIGSEGTLGIITAASLRLYPKPASRLAALVGCDGIEQALALLSLARHALDAALTGFEVMQAYPVDLALRHLPGQAKAARQLVSADGAMPRSSPQVARASRPSPAADLPGLPALPGLPNWTVLLDAASPHPQDALQQQLEALLAQALEQGLVQQACIAQSDTQYREMWTLRETIPLAEKAEGLMVKHDIAVPTSQVPAFLSRAKAALNDAFPGCRIVCFGHLGDGNLHYNVQSPPGMADRAFLATHEHGVNKVVYDIALALGGTISAEHGIGQLKREELGERQGAVGTAWMRAIKQALDPQGILNPGRLVP